MKISINWLNKYTQLKADPTEIAEVLTMLGLEVEEIAIKGATDDNIVSAKVKSCGKHPDADKLSLCKVFDGSETYNVVCGAPNVKADQTVVFARVGAVLPGDFTIKKAKIRGEESQGMICAEDEIGLGTNHEGILELPENTPLGLPLHQIPGMTDTILELSITPNRPDALSHLGVARELSGHYKTALNLPEIPTINDVPDTDFKIDVMDAQGCPMYTAKIIRGVKIGPSPDWLVTALESVGQKSINNVVDLSNFVLLEFGQPSHTFDLDKIKGRSLTIRQGKKGETLETLDEIKRNIESDLVIADETGPVCLAGVMGGASTKVDDSTQNILLEVAYFKPQTIRTQARKHVSSDSSYRFERGVDPLNITYVSDYLCKLICKLTGGTLAEVPETFCNPKHPREKIKVDLRPDKVNKILGLKLSDDEIASLLLNIQIEKLTSDNPDNITFSIPGFRPDLTREIDLVEEVARLYNFNNIPDELPAYSPVIVELPELESMSLKIRRHLCSLGLNECISLRFAPQKHVEYLQLKSETSEYQSVKLLNPLSEETETLPVSLLHNLLSSAAKNQKNQEKNCRLFEVGKTFIDNKEHRDKKNPGVIEENKLALVLTGEWPSVSWTSGKQSLDFYTLKGLVENLLACLGIKYKMNYGEPVGWLHPGESATILCGKSRVGTFGTLHPKVVKTYDLEPPVMACEISLTNVLNVLPARIKKKAYKPYSTSVSTKREMNIVVNKNMKHQEVLDLMPLNNVKYLEQVKLNNIYEGEGIPENQKALNYSFVYRHPTKTLTDAEVNKIQEKIAKHLEKIPEITFK